MKIAAVTADQRFSVPDKVILNPVISRIFLQARNCNVLVLYIPEIFAFLTLIS